MSTSDWRQKAACRDMDGELFFPIGVGGLADIQTREAKSVCTRCPVMDQCLQWAVATRQDSGVWGGLSEEERRRMSRRKVRAYEVERDGQSAVGHIMEKRRDEFLGLQAQELTPKAIATAMRTNVQTIYSVQAALIEAGLLVDPDDMDQWLTGGEDLPSREARLAAVMRGVARGMTYVDIDNSRGVPEQTTSKFISRMRKRYAEQGRPLPKLCERQQASFTNEEAAQIREEYAAGGTTDLALSMKYGVTPKTITVLLSGDTYRDAGGPIRPKRSGQPSMASRVLWGGGQEGFLKTAV